jgi:hypothetical protein
MLIRCTSLPGPSGLVQTTTSGGERINQTFHAVSVGQVYRPFAMHVRPRPFGNASAKLQSSYLIRRDAQPGLTLSFVFVAAEHFELIEQKIDGGWALLSVSEDGFLIGAAIAQDLERLSEKLSHDDKQTGEIFLQETTI